ncbi:MAG TPA: hypothetical protein VM802_23795 [Chitinophaga sp.]|uniref:hypothetical protein n=1 Tax=Chitinophaga sp. TaxID=1869181 RepID=UPI002CC22073|nr:hypothetical protein [Chitinophaga sp.]HVI47912.1 hypothetical protein [Chitinophaga sp.]
MRSTKTRVNSMLVLLLALAVISSCKKEEQSSPTEQVKPVAGQTVEDHITITPERQKVIDFFKQNANARGEASGAVAKISYRGFTVNYSGTVPNDVKSLVTGEIDQLLSTSTSSTTKQHMTGAPINVYNSPGSGDLFYSNGNVYIVNFSVYRSVHTAPGNVIIHELFHYLHDRWVPGGFNNSTIYNMYVNAYYSGVYPSSAYVMSNQVEYLGVSAEANYTGTNRPPYNASTLASSDPDLKSYLTTNF